MLVTATAMHGQSLPYRNSSLPVEQRVTDLLSRMTREEKFWQLYMIPGELDDSTHDYSKGIFGLQVRMLGKDTSALVARAHAERMNTIQRYFVERTRLGIPVLFFEEGLHGVMADGATVFPQAIGLAASWDTSLMRRVSLATALEARRRGIRQLLSPVINIATDVRWGRTEETYGEDPFLTSLMGDAYVRVMEAAEVVATPKHFVANVGDGGRDSYPIELSERRLAEVHYAPFRRTIAAGSRSVMSSYNSVDGTPATQNRHLLTDKLRNDFKFSGFVISDMAATSGATVLHFTEANTPQAAAHAFAAGLDVVFQSSWPQHKPYLEAFTRGLIADSIIDRAVRRVLTAKFQLGLFDQPYVVPDSAAIVAASRANGALALEAARRSIVLLKNSGALPLKSGGRVAVIGDDAANPRFGGYSGNEKRGVSLLSALRMRLGAGKVTYARGVSRIDSTWQLVPGTFRGEYFDNIELSGTPIVTQEHKAIDFAWIFSPPAEGLPLNWYSVRWTGTVTVPTTGANRIGVEGSEGYRLYLDDRLVLDTWNRQSAGPRLAPVRLLPGSIHRIRLEYRETSGNGRVRLIWNGGVASQGKAQIAEAVRIARGSTVAVIAGGIEEGEFRDRSSLTLPGHQEELIRAVARTGTPVVVVLYGGSAVVMESWLDSVAAVVQAWYPGEQGGPAVADVLLGEYNPAGRLPITFPQTEGQLPLVYNHKPTGRGDDYLDRTGAPRFPFGFGLSYTTFSYDSLRISPAIIAPGESSTITVTVRNRGARAGDEVVQLYVRDLLASVSQPVLALKGFERIHLAPGASAQIRFTVGPSELEMLNGAMERVIEPGDFRILIGSSAADLRLMGTLQVRAP